MKQFIIDHPILVGFTVMVLTIIFILIFLKAMQILGLDKCRAVVYKAFVTAENSFKDGNDKFEYVISIAVASIPKPFSYFINEKLVRKTVQLWFDLCKDLLDDGRVNSVEDYKSLNEEQD